MMNPLLANYNIPLPLETLVEAGFVVTDRVDKVNHYYRFYLLHESVFEMTSEQAHDQPHIEIGIPDDELLKNRDSFPVYIEGRYGAMRYPIQIAGQLHLFMRNFGYTYPVNQQESEDDDDERFDRCADCDDHDACADFGCAIQAGLGHMVRQE